MSIYSYRARDQQGGLIRGTVEAGSEKEAVTLIRDRSLLLTSLVPQVSHGFSLSLQGFRRISFGDIVTFTRQLSTMINAGLQIQEALTLLKTQSTNSLLIDMLGKISRDISAGGSLASSLTKFPRQFSSIYLALIKAGESSGTLDRVLEQLSANLEKDQEFRSKIRGAMVYPAIILLVMVVVFFILMTLVVPKLTEIYADFGADLPLATQILKTTSDIMVRFWWLIIIGGLFGFRLFRQWYKTSFGRHTWDGFIFRLPLLGPLQKQIILVDFTRTLGMLVGAGVHIIDSLTILVDALGNIHFQEAVKDITKKVEKGFPLGALFAQNSLFPPILAQMVKVGEETGKMDESLLKLSIYFERESDHMVKALTTAIEPIIMVILGVGVGFIVFAIITPIYNLTAQF